MVGGAIFLSVFIGLALALDALIPEKVQDKMVHFFGLD